MATLNPVNANTFSQLGKVMQANVARGLFNGVRPGSSTNAPMLQDPGVSGAFMQSLTVSSDGLTFRCNINICEDTGICGP